MRLSLEVSAAWLAAKLQAEALQPAFANLGLHKPKCWAENGALYLSIRHGGGQLAQRLKAKVTLAAQGGALLLDLRDLRVQGISIGGGWLERIASGLTLPGGLSLKQLDGQLWLRCPGLSFIAAGIVDGNIDIILEADT